MVGVIFGRTFAESGMSHLLLFDKTTLSLMLPAYAFVAACLPVWVLMCPRDYLSSYMKIGVMVVLGAGILIAHPTLKMPAMTPFTAGDGPVISGTVWPFVCIVVMCGAISGFHALVGSGTTPKMIHRESEIRLIGYGAMLVEGFVAVLALVAACSLEPGDYFAINTNPATHAAMVQTVSAQHGWDLAVRELPALEQGTQEHLAGRVGGAVTLAVGMAKVFCSLPGLKQLMSYWYHFIIMFEALFILTLLETGTRVARFVFQEAAATFTPRAVIGGKPHWGVNIAMSALVCGAWGYLLYSGNLNTLWRMLGIANQLLASIALAVGTTCLLRYAPKRRYALCTGIPFVFLLVTVLVAGVTSVHQWWGQIATVPASQVLMLRLTCGLATMMQVLTVVIALDAFRAWYRLICRRD